MVIYVHGCTTCGIVSHLINRVRRDCPTIEVKNTRYDSAAREEHAAWLTQAGMVADHYAPIVVIDGNVTKLQAWNTSI